jgi:hypothetical protein
MLRAMQRDITSMNDVRGPNPKPNLMRPSFGLLNNSTKLEISTAKYQQKMLQRQAAAVKGMGGGMAYSTLKQRALTLRTCTRA